MSATLLAFTALLGCARGSSSVEPARSSSHDASSSAATARTGDSVDCSRFRQEDAAEEDNFRKGKQQIQACDELCMKSQSGGKGRSEGVDRVHEAARRGHLGAQSLYGRTLFYDLMTTGDEEALQDEYVDAIYFLTLAARRGDEVVRAEFPELATLTAEGGTLSAPLTAPFSDLNETWVKEGVERAQRDMRCFAK